MPPSLYEVILWIRTNGEVEAENRLRIRTLPLTMREGISFARIRPSTVASEQLVAAMAREASLVVGKPFPIDAAAPSSTQQRF